jgi:GNAT superfamily N-acetyltransferase
VRIERLTAAHLERLHALFEAAPSTCFCRYWHFEGTKNEWLDRCAHRPEENRAELDAAVRERREDAEGVVAIGEDETILGWMKLTARSSVPKLRRLPVYRSLDLGDEGSTFSVGCFLVHPAHRRTGIARALLEGAEEIACLRGASAIEGYPRRSSSPLHDEEAWQGPEGVFVERGFQHVAGEAPYPVYRKVLRDQNSGRSAVSG